MADKNSNGSFSLLEAVVGYKASSAPVKNILLIAAKYANTNTGIFYASKERIIAQSRLSRNAGFKAFKEASDSNILCETGRKHGATSSVKEYFLNREELLKNQLQDEDYNKQRSRKRTQSRIELNTAKGKPLPANNYTNDNANNGETVQTESSIELNTAIGKEYVQTESSIELNTASSVDQVFSGSVDIDGNGEATDSSIELNTTIGKEYAQTESRIELNTASSVDQVFSGSVDVDGNGEVTGSRIELNTAIGEEYVQTESRIESRTQSRIESRTVSNKRNNQTLKNKGNACAREETDVEQVDVEELETVNKNKGNADAPYSLETDVVVDFLTKWKAIAERDDETLFARPIRKGENGHIVEHLRKDELNTLRRLLTKPDSCTDFLIYALQESAKYDVMVGNIKPVNLSYYINDQRIEQLEQELDKQIDVYREWKRDNPDTDQQSDIGDTAPLEASATTIEEERRYASSGYSDQDLPQRDTSAKNSYSNAHDGEDTVPATDPKPEPTPAPIPEPEPVPEAAETDSRVNQVLLDSQEATRILDKMDKKVAELFRPKMDECKTDAEKVLVLANILPYLKSSVGSRKGMPKVQSFRTQPKDIK